MSDQNMKALVKIKLQKTAEALQKNNMEAFVTETKEDAKALLEKMLVPGETIGMGGTMTAAESGITELLKSGKYNFLDRSLPNLTREDIQNIYKKSFLADTYIASSNAVTENGELYNVDGNANRVAAMLFGPERLIVIAGCNKIVKNIDEAILRVKTIAAPANCIRLGMNTYCAAKGACVSTEGRESFLCDGCTSDDRICSNYTVMARQRNKDRVKVILVAESLGY